MSKPKILTMFDDTAKDSIYSKLNNPVTTTLVDRSLVISDITDVHDNSIVTFKPECNCADVDSITINGEVYEIKDSLGNTLDKSTIMWVDGAVISVALDAVTKVAYTLNSNFGAAAPSVATSAVLTASGWDVNTKTLTVNVNGVTTDNNIIVTPSIDTYPDYTDANIICTSLSVGSLTFKCDTIPSIDINANILILG